MLLHARSTALVLLCGTATCTRSAKLVLLGDIVVHHANCFVCTCDL